MLTSRRGLEAFICVLVLLFLGGIGVATFTQEQRAEGIAGDQAAFTDAFDEAQTHLDALDVLAINPDSSTDDLQAATRHAAAAVSAYESLQVDGPFAVARDHYKRAAEIQLSTLVHFARLPDADTRAAWFESTQGQQQLAAHERELDLARTAISA